jgi:phosphatidylglycerol:prolipoprotein diacylglycerol transferase
MNSAGRDLSPKTIAPAITGADSKEDERAMVFPDFDPVLLQIGPIAIRWYALAYVAGILLGWWYALRLVRNEKIWAPVQPPLTKVQIDDLVLWSTLGIIVGGRLGSVIFYNTEMIWTRPIEIVQVWKGGMSFHGGFIGVALAIFFYARSQKIPVLRLADLVAPCVPFGLFFGRIANFINSELWGRETDVPWGISPRLGEPARHPSQLYEAALEGVLLFLILRLATHRFGQLRNKGALTGLFMLTYGVFRILVEQVREPDANLSGWPFGLTMGIVLSVPMALIGLWLLVRSQNGGKVVLASVPPSARQSAEPAIASAAAVPPVIEAVMPVAEIAPPATPKAKPKPKVAPKPKASPAAKTPSARKPAAKAAVAKPADKPVAKSSKPRAAAKPATTTAAKPKPKPKPKPKS